MKVALNPQYAIRNGSTCSFIIPKTQTVDNRITTKSIQMIPPFWGYILSAFVGDDFEETLYTLANQLNVSFDTLKKTVCNLINNETFKSINLNNDKIYIPPFILVEVDKYIGNDVASESVFTPFNQFKKVRSYIPFNVNLMITTHCKTSCIYCYAKRDKNCDLDLAVIRRLIKEMKEIRVVNLSITGGDIFAHNHWKEIVETLHFYGYKSFLSTKIPLTKEDISFLKKNDIDELQFSIDSFIAEELSTMIVPPPNYIEKVHQMLQCAEEQNLKINVRSVLTKYNTTIVSIENTLNRLKQYKCINEWMLTPAFYSAYKDDYKNYKASNEQLETIDQWLSMQKAPFNIYRNNIKNKLQNYKSIYYKDRNEFIKRNKACTANSFGLSILVTGIATACEMLYDNMHCQLGNITTQSISEIWNSFKALKLYSATREELLHKEGNPCYTCELYTQCRGENDKKICYADVINAYGEEFYDFPDPRCPQAPPFNHDRIIY